MADASEAFREAIEGLGYGETPERRLTPAEVSQRAIERAGTSDKKSRAYKSARRTIERHRTTAGQSRGQPNRRFARQLLQRGLRVFAVVELDVSPDPRRKGQDMRPRTIDVYISGDQLEPMAAALERADLSLAEGEFYHALLRTYEEAGDGPSFLASASIGDVAALRISWGDGDDDYDRGDLPF